MTEVRKWRGKSGGRGRDRIRRAEHGKAISVQPRFLVSAKGIFGRGGEEGRRGGGTAENLHAREFSSVCRWRVSVKKEKEKRKTDELPLVNRSLLPFFPFLTGNYSISSVQLIDALYET